MEVWALIDDFPLYEVSNMGQVRNRNTGRIIKQSKHPRTGLLWVPLRRDLVQHTRNVHRLVAYAFLGDAPSGCVPIHEDGDRSNNCVTNLDWRTLSAARDLTQERSRSKPIDPRKVRLIEEDRIFENALTAAHELRGFEKYVLFAARSSGTASYRGGHWEFV